jgi:NADH dehydrogenase
VAGPDAVTHEQLYERIASLIGRRPFGIPIPDFLVRHGSRVANTLGLSIHLEAALEGFFAPEISLADNALESMLGGAPTRLDDGLRQLIVGLDEVTPAEGVGSVQVKRFWADVHESRFDAADLLRLFRERFAEIMPIPVGVEPAAPATTLDEGAVITMALPGRGHVQVRVQEVTPEHVVVATLRGHAVAGIVRFSARRHESSVRFEVTTCDAAANPIDWLALSLGGARIQDANWTRVVQKVVDLSGGTSEGIATAIQTLNATAAAEAERWIRGVIETPAEYGRTL